MVVGQLDTMDRGQICLALDGEWGSFTFDQMNNFTLNRYAFQRFLRCVFIPESCTAIPDACFARNPVLSRVTFAKRSIVKRIGESAFSDCPRLQEIDIPASVVDVGKMCFHSRQDGGSKRGSSLSRVTFAPGSVLKCIEKDAFYGCTCLKEIEIPASVEEIKQGWLSGSHFSRITFASGSHLRCIGDYAFSQCLLKEIEIPASVEKIGQECFSKSHYLSRVTFANGSVLKSIGPSAFSNCYKLFSIEVPASADDLDVKWLNGSSVNLVIFGNGTKRIAERVLSGLYGLTEVHIPATVEEIGDNSFSACTNLSRVAIATAGALKSIGKSAFKYCSRLDKIEIPASVENIGDKCFSNDSKEDSYSMRYYNGLSQITFAKGSVLKRIGTEAFSGCKFLKEIKIPASIEELAKGWTHGSGISKVTFAERRRMKKISKHAFSENLHIKKIQIPASVEELDDHCFAASCISNIIFESGSILKRINQYAFSGCLRLRRIEIPATVEEIGSYSFAGSALLSVTFQSGSILKRINQYAFSKCSYLNEICIPATVEEIGDGCFKRESSINGSPLLWHVTFANGSRLRRIGKQAFFGCTNISDIEIPASLEEIDDECFQCNHSMGTCACLSRITFASGSVLKRIGNRVFEGCKKLKEIKIPASVEEIGDHCFSDLKCLSCVEFDENAVLKRIGESALSNCGFTKIAIPGSVQEIGDGCFCGTCVSDVIFTTGSRLKCIGKRAFMDCRRLQTLEIPASVEKLGEYCFESSSISQIAFGSDSALKHIGEGAFISCRNFKEIEIPASVEELGVRCFSGSFLSKITFAKGSVLKRIRSHAFSECNHLQVIEIPASVEEIGDGCFKFGCNGSNTKASGMFWARGWSTLSGSLSSITFAKGSVLKRIGDEAFSGCAKLKEIEIPGCVEELGTNLFVGCDISRVNFTDTSNFHAIEPFIVSSKTKSLVCVSLDIKKIEIPAFIMEIGDNSLTCSSLVSISFAKESSVKRFGKHAFSECKLLEEIEIPASVEEIGEGCFQFSHSPIARDESAQNVFSEQIPEHKTASTSWGCAHSAYEWGSSTGRQVGRPISSPSVLKSSVEKQSEPVISSLSRVTFESGSRLKRIEKDAFSGCCVLTEIEIPESVVEIGEGCFYECSSLSRVAFPGASALKCLGKRAFGECMLLREIEIPASVEEIREECFHCELPTSGTPMKKYASSLSSVTFASGSCLKSIEKSVFADCVNLQEIEIPATVESIGEKCFCGCSSLSGVTFASGNVLNRIGDMAFSGCRKLKEIEIPANIEEITMKCFFHCVSLSRVTFGNARVKKLGKKAFGECGLEELEIPSSVEEIGKKCFVRCPNLCKLTFAAGSSLNTVGPMAFIGCAKLQKVDVPAKHRRYW